MADQPGQYQMSGYGGNQYAQQYNQQLTSTHQQQGRSNDMYSDLLAPFWEQQKEEVSQVGKDPAEFKNHQLPLARIKKIMKSDEDVRMISAEAPVLFAKACEMFILELTLRSWAHAEENRRRTLQRSDVAAAISRNEFFDFLADIIPLDEAAKAEQAGAVGTAAALDDLGTASTSAAAAAVATVSQQAAAATAAATAAAQSMFGAYPYATADGTAGAVAAAGVDPALLYQQQVGLVPSMPPQQQWPGLASGVSDGQQQQQ